MIKLNSDIIKSAYIGAKLKKIIEEKGKTITSIAENMGISQPALSRVLNGKVGGSDNFFIKTGNAIPITEKELKKIFFEAEKEKIKYEFGEELLSSKEFSFDELLEMVKEKKNLTDEEIQSVRKFIEFQENQKK